MMHEDDIRAAYEVQEVYYISETVNQEAQLAAASKSVAMGKKVAIVYPDGKVEVLT